MQETSTPGRVEFLLAVWKRLAAARSVTLSVRDGATGVVQARGAGSVDVETVGGTEMVIRERGRWSAPRGPGAHFTDALRWTLDTDMAVLRLEHLRRGPDEPVPLVELVDDGEGGLEPLAPHLCGDDRYEGSLRMVDGVVEVAWRVTGPKKDQEIIRRYR